MAGAVFVIATDLWPEHAAWARTQVQAAHLQNFAARALGVDARVELACLPARATEDPGDRAVGRVIDQSVGLETSVLFVLPATFELNLWRRTALGNGSRRIHEEPPFPRPGPRGSARGYPPLIRLGASSGTVQGRRRSPGS
jgi:hypothetical protein